MIGDNIPIDIILPKKLGIKTMLLDRERKDIKCPQADFIVNDLKEAIQLLIFNKYEYVFTWICFKDSLGLFIKKGI